MSISKLSKVLRTANLDHVIMEIIIKQKVLNGERLHRGSDKTCTVRGALRFIKIIKIIQII